MMPFVGKADEIDLSSIPNRYLPYSLMPYPFSLIRVRFEQFRKGDHLTAICIKYYLITENSLKTMPNFTEKGWAEAPEAHP